MTQKPQKKPKPKKKKLTIVEKALAELHSGFNTSSSHGPSKSINSVSFELKKNARPNGPLKGVLTVNGSAEGLHQDDWDTERKFTVTPQELEKIAQLAHEEQAELRKLSVQFNKFVADLRDEIVERFATGFPADLEGPSKAVFRQRKNPKP